MPRRAVLPLVAVLALVGCTDEKSDDPPEGAAQSASSATASASHDTVASPCHEADPNVLRRIAQGKRDSTVKYVTTRMVTANGTTVVLAVTDLGEAPRPAPTGSPSPSPTPAASQSPAPIIEGWIIDPAGTITRLGNAPKASTTFPVTEKPDRSVTPLVERAARCLREKPVR